MLVDRPQTRFNSTARYFLLSIFLYLLCETAFADDDKRSTKTYLYMLYYSLLMKALSELLESTLVLISHQIDEKHRAPQRQNRRQLNTHQQIAYDTFQQLIRYKQILLRGLFVCSNLAMTERFFGAIDYLLKEKISPLSLSYPEESTTNPIFSFLHAPAIVPVLAGLSIIGSVYNLRELVMLIRQKIPRPDDSPFFGLVNALSLISTSIEMKSALITDEEVLFFEVGTTLEEIQSQILAAQHRVNQKPVYLPLLLQCINMSAPLRAYLSLSYLLKQIISGSIDRFSIEVSQSALEQPRRQPPRKRKTGRQTPPTLSPSEPTPEPSEFLFQAEQTHSEPSPQKKEKIKTRGTPNPTRQETGNTHTIDALPSRVVYNSSQRQSKLDLLDELRQFNQVKARVIESELVQCIRYLPKARIENLGGSEFRLVWHWQDKQYGLKFEKPHGNHTEYQGFKLKKMLNVLETAYLWGWDPHKIQSHLETHHRIGYLGRLSHILFERPEPFSTADLPNQQLRPH